MHAISIGSILSTYDRDEKYYQSYCQYNQLNIKDHEVNTLKKLSDLIPEIIYYNFYVGYEIPQLGKEFDLLKFTHDKILNIELKSKSTEKKVKKQLLRNVYYLEALGLETILITYNAEISKFYFLDIYTEELIELSLERVKKILESFGTRCDVSLNELFQPTNYLVSPFNATDKFLNNEYLLTPQQENIVREIKEKIQSRSIKNIAIEGGPGTGKTLLTYHLAKELSSQYNTLIVHCGTLNKGQERLKENSKLNIISVKSLRHINPSEYELIILDEAQRIYQAQVKDLIIKGKDEGYSLLFSYDPIQRISWKEMNSKSVESIKQATEQSYLLSEKIRTNKELGAFIKNLFDLSKRSPEMEYKNITLELFNEAKEINFYLTAKEKEGWKYIQYTNSIYNKVSYDEYQGGYNDENTHKTIGQEFDKVIIVIDSTFYYDDDGNLMSNGYTGGTGYSMHRMLYQNITRVRKELKIVVLNNQIVFQRIMDILH